MKLTEQRAGAEQGRPMLEFRDGVTNELKSVVWAGGNGFERQELFFEGTAEEREAQLAAWKQQHGY